MLFNDSKLISFNFNKSNLGFISNHKNLFQRKLKILTYNKVSIQPTEMSKIC